MSISAGTLKRLAALQLAPEAMQEVLSIIASCIEPLEERRRRDRDRKPKRGNSKENPRNIQGISSEIPVENPPQHILPPQESSKPKRVSRSAVDIPERPTEEARVFARSEGWDDERTNREWQRFRDHSLAKGRKHRDLMAAWRNWVRSPYQTNGASNAKPGSGSNIVDASRRLEQRLKQFNEPPPGGDLCDRAGNADVRLLSKG